MLTCDENYTKTYTDITCAYFVEIFFLANSCIQMIQSENETHVEHGVM